MLLHALASLNIKHSVAPSTGDDYSSEDELPCPSRPCEWKKPKQKKESTLMIDKAEFVKHDYAKPVKKKMCHLDDFDPRPLEFRGTASSRLPELLDSLKGENLCISLLFDPRCQSNAVLPSEQPSTANLPDSATLHATMLSLLIKRCDHFRLFAVSRDLAHIPKYSLGSNS